MSTNDITGDALRSKPNTKQYEENYDRIFQEEPHHDIEEETEAPAADSSDS